MSDVVEIGAIVRMAMLDRVVRGLREAGVPRLTVTRLHSLGAGVDPATARPSAEDGAEESSNALVQFICAAERAEMYVELLARCARTGRRGDGIVWVQPVASVVKIRTGAEGLAALA